MSYFMCGWGLQSHSTDFQDTVQGIRTSGPLHMYTGWGLQSHGTRNGDFRATAQEMGTSEPLHKESGCATHSSITGISMPGTPQHYQISPPHPQNCTEKISLNLQNLYKIMRYDCTKYSIYNLIMKSCQIMKS